MNCKKNLINLEKKAIILILESLYVSVDNKLYYMSEVV